VPSRFCLSCGAFLSVAASLVTSAVWAEAASLSYRAPLDCPGEADFVRAVAARGGQFAAGAGGERRFQVTIARDAGGYVGSFRVGRPQGDSAERAVHAPSCHEVVDGLAVAAALALQASPPHAAESVPSPPPVAPPLAPQPPTRRDEGAAPERLSLGPAFTLTAFGGLAFGLVPSTPMPRYELSVTWASLAHEANRGRIVGPLMRLGLNLYGGVTHEMNGISTKLGAQALTVGPCYAPLYDDRGLVLMTCLDLTAGLMGASSTDRETGAANSDSFGFGSVGASLEAAYNIGRHFHVAFRAGSNALVAPISVKGADGSELFRSSRYNGFATFGAGGHF
jgi:hypothetical protein